MDVSYKIIGSNMKKARKAAGLTQEQTAERLGMSTLHYGRLERGKRPASLKQLTRICDTLNVDFETLLSDCILDRKNHAAVFEAAADLPSGVAEYALLLLDEYREQIKAYYNELCLLEKNSR